jgi:hypothetical protein
MPGGATGIIPPHRGSDPSEAARQPAVRARWTGPRVSLMLQAMTPLPRLLGFLAVAVVVAVPVMPAGAVLLAQSAAPETTAGDTVPGESGVFIIRHAGDTVATERFSRTATTLHGTLAIRNAKGTLQAYEAVMAPDASVPLIEVTVRETQDSGQTNGRILQRARVIFKEDSAAVDDIGTHGMQTRIFGTERGAVPYLNLSFALLEQAVRRSRATTPEATQVPFFNLGGGQTVDARVSKLGADSVSMAIGSVEFRLRVDTAGRVLGGTIPAQQLVAERVSGS